MSVKQTNFVNNSQPNLDADFLNSVKNEINNVIVGTGKTLDDKNNSQLKESIEEMIQGGGEGSSSNPLIGVSDSERIKSELTLSSPNYISYIEVQGTTDKPFILYFSNGETKEYTQTERIFNDDGSKSLNLPKSGCEYIIFACYDTEDSSKTLEFIALDEKKIGILNENEYQYRKTLADMFFFHDKENNFLKMSIKETYVFCPLFFTGVYVYSAGRLPIEKMFFSVERYNFIHFMNERDNIICTEDIPESSVYYNSSKLGYMQIQPDNTLMPTKFFMNFIRKDGVVIPLQIKGGSGDSGGIPRLEEVEDGTTINYGDLYTFDLDFVAGSSPSSQVPTYKIRTLFECKYKITAYSSSYSPVSLPNYWYPISSNFCVCNGDLIKRIIWNGATCKITEENNSLFKIPLVYVNGKWAYTWQFFGKSDYFSTQYSRDWDFSPLINNTSYFPKFIFWDSSYSTLVAFDKNKISIDKTGDNNPTAKNLILKPFYNKAGRTPSNFQALKGKYLKAEYSEDGSSYRPCMLSPYAVSLSSSLSFGFVGNDLSYFFKMLE